jgi:hypothetical protein
MIRLMSRRDQLSADMAAFVFREAGSGYNEWIPDDSSLMLKPVAAITRPHFG